MQKDTLLSLVRTLFTLIGSFIIGKALWGNMLEQNTWEIIGGAILTLIGTIWGIVDKSATIEAVQSGVRSVIISIGGILVAAGYITGKSLDSILGFMAAIITVIQSYTSKVKVQQIHQGDLKTTNAGKVIKMILLILFTSSLVKGQSILKSLPKSTAITTSNQLVQPATPDSFLNAIRPIVGVAAFSEPGNQLMTGAGLGYQHLKWDYNSQKWNSEYSISLLGWAAGSVSPGPNIPAFATGPAIGFFNNLILVGGAYDFTHGKWIGCLSLGISLNN